MDTDDQDRAPAVLTGLRGRGYRSTTILGALEIAVPSARAGELEALRHRVERLERELGECQRRQSAMAAAPRHASRRGGDHGRPAAPARRAPVMRRVALTRTVAVPDRLRLARYRRAPELGPRVLFFSGGSALRDVSGRLTEYTHNSIHLITPFDSGGSSAKLREAFGMISVGDLRNRLMALADTRLRGHPETYRLFGYRFALDEENEAHWSRLKRMVTGEDPLVDAIPNPMRSIICNHLAFFAGQAPAEFDLRGASVGNLILTGGYLNHGRDMDAVTFTFSKLVEARGLVRPVVDADCHLQATLEDGHVVTGQHRLTGKEVPPLTSPIVDLRLVETGDPERAVDVEIDKGTRRFVDTAELICFPFGSYYTSVLACLLPRGLGRAVAEAGCPKVFVPNCDADPEQARPSGGRSGGAPARLPPTKRSRRGSRPTASSTS